ncbi:sensor histidine kinase [Nocardia sp. NBC_01388]|uniref:sensor histidine kinase n=1 Tax=Nocardia sp. NBC_01388 TaxID=2903596 RepID=UPI0032542768
MSVLSVERRDWIIGVLLAVLVVIGGLVQVVIGIHDNLFPNRGTVVPVVVMTAFAVAVGRRRPALGLACSWVLCGYQIVTGAPILVVQVGLAAVLFAAARSGAEATVLAGLLSVPMGALLAYLGLGTYSGFLVAALFGVCWLAGLMLRRSAVRVRDSLASQRVAEQDAATAQRESRQAREIAQLRAEQAQLARDVHDVVGHSLGVIVAQAESAQFLPDTDIGALRSSMANIARVARSSLQDVRGVLTASASGAEAGELHTLIETVRASGYAITVENLGTARALAPDLATVAYRTLQEMLTNAIRHGSRGAPARVELCWSTDELRIEVVNPVEPGAADSLGGSGRGLDGMRQRLESVGGRLEIRHDPAEAGASTASFVAAAAVPVRRMIL